MLWKLKWHFYCSVFTILFLSLMSDYSEVGILNAFGNSNGSSLFCFPMAFGFPMVLSLEQKGGHFVLNHWEWEQNGAILLRFPMYRFQNGRDHSYSYCYNRPFQNRTIGNPSFKTFIIPTFGIQSPLYFNLSNTYFSVPLSIYQYVVLFFCRCL